MTNPVVAPPNSELPVSPIGPDFLGFMWEWTNLNTTGQSLMVGILLCLGITGGALVLGAFLGHFVPYVGKFLQSILSVASVAAFVSTSFLVGSWISDEAVDSSLMTSHAQQVHNWIRASGNPHATSEQALALVCEYHMDKSEVCGKSIGGVAVGGYNEPKVVLRLNDAGQYRVMDAASAGAVDL